MVFSKIQSPPLVGITATKQTANSSDSFWGIANVVQYTCSLHLPLSFSSFYMSVRAVLLTDLLMVPYKENSHPRMALACTVNKALTWLWHDSFLQQLCDNCIPTLQLRKLKWVLQIYTERNPGQVTRLSRSIHASWERFIPCASREHWGL